MCFFVCACRSAPTDDFLFLPPTLPPSGSPPSPRFASNNSASPVLVLPERSRPSAAFPHLSPSIFSSQRAREQLIWATAGSLFSSFIAQPFEAGKVLSQVQYLPRRTSLPKPAGPDSVHEAEGTTEDEEEPNDEEDAQAYFEELIVNASSLQRIPEEDVLGGVARKGVDADGYVLRTDEDGVKMEWVLKRGEANGPFAMTKRLWNGEGPTAPWKGEFQSSWYPTLPSSRAQLECRSPGQGPEGRGGERGSSRACCRNVTSNLEPPTDSSVTSLHTVLRPESQTVTATGEI